MTVDEPRRADSSWHMRPSDASAAAAAGNDGQSVNPLVVSFPAGFHPPVSGWEAYEGAGGQQLLVVARAGTDADFVGVAKKASNNKKTGKSSSASSNAASAASPPCFAVASVDCATGDISYSRLATAGGPLRLTPHARRRAQQQQHDWLRGDDGALALPSPSSGGAKGSDARAAAAAAKEAASLAAAAAALAERADRAATAGAKRALVAAFGSEKSRKKLAAAARGAVDGDGDAALGGGAAAAGVAALLTKAAAAAAAEGAPRDAAAAAAAASRAVTLPKHHPNAKAVHEAYVLDELVPPGALAALEAAADRLVVAVTAVKTEGEERVKKAEGEAAAAAAVVAPPSSPPASAAAAAAAAAVEEFPGCVLSRASALLRLRKKEGGGTTPTTTAAEAQTRQQRRRSLRALALLAAALRLRRASRALRVDPAKGGYDSLGKKLGISADLLRPMLEGGEYASAASSSAAATAAPSPSSPSPSPLALNFSRGGLPERKLASLTLVLALLACDGDLSPAAFESLRSELKASSRELASSFREVGARASPVSRSGGGKRGGGGSSDGVDGDVEEKEEEGAKSPLSPLSSPAGKPHRRYAVKLLVGEKPGTELGACFPALKLGRR